MSEDDFLTLVEHPGSASMNSIGLTAANDLLRRGLFEEAIRAYVGLIENGCPLSQIAIGQIEVAKSRRKRLRNTNGDSGCIRYYLQGPKSRTYASEEERQETFKTRGGLRKQFEIAAPSPALVYEFVQGQSAPRVPIERQPIETFSDAIYEIISRPVTDVVIHGCVGISHVLAVVESFIWGAKIFQQEQVLHWDDLVATANRVLKEPEIERYSNSRLLEMVLDSVQRSAVKVSNNYKLSTVEATNSGISAVSKVGSSNRSETADRSLLNQYDWDLYLKHNPDAAGYPRGIRSHFIERGKREGRKAFQVNHKPSPVRRHELSLINKSLTEDCSSWHDTLVYFVNVYEDLVLPRSSDWPIGISYTYTGIRNSRLDQSGAWQFAPALEFSNGVIDLHRILSYKVFGYLKKFPRVAYVSSPELVDTPLFKRMRNVSRTGSEPICISGVKKTLDISGANIPECALKNAQLKPDSLYNGEAIDVVVPEVMLLTSEAQALESTLFDWLIVCAENDLPFCIPSALVKSFGVYFFPEPDLDRRREPIPIQRYLELYPADHFANKALYTVEGSPLKARDQGSARVSVIIPIFNALEAVKECLASVVGITYRNYEVVLADDCSDLDVIQWLRAFSHNHANVRLLESTENLGYTKNVNRAIDQCLDSHYMILLNSDTVVPPSLIDSILDVFRQDENIGIVGPLSNAAGWQSVPNIRGANAAPGYCRIETINRYIAELNSESKSCDVSIVNGFCFALSRRVVQAVGTFDSALFPQGYGEEDDYCFRARRSGFLLKVALGCYVHHAKSKSFGHDRRIHLATKSRAILDRRWGARAFEKATSSIEFNPLLSRTRQCIAELFNGYKPQTSVIGEEIAEIADSRPFSSCAEYRNGVAVHLHLFYPEMSRYFAFYISKLTFAPDVFVTVNSARDAASAEQELAPFVKGRLTVFVVSNRGRDVRPFLYVLEKVSDKYSYILHIHSKRSSHEPRKGARWLAHLMGSLVANEPYVKNLLELMRQNKWGVVFPCALPELYQHYSWRANRGVAKRLLEAIYGSSDDLWEELYFPVGNMFWADVDALADALNLEQRGIVFPEEPIPLDGSVLHALERLWPTFVRKRGYGFKVVKPASYDFTYKQEIDFCAERSLDCKNVEMAVTSAMSEGNPFAMIRFYDGEGAFYRADAVSDKYLSERMKYYFGNGAYSKEDALDIRGGLLEALSCADIVGGADPEELEILFSYARDFGCDDLDDLITLRRRYDSTRDCGSVWRVLAAFELVLLGVLSGKPTCSYQIQYHLLKSGGLYRIIHRASRVSVINCHRVSGLLRKIFKKPVKQYHVPERAFDLAHDGHTKHYPTYFRKLCAQLSKVKVVPGEVFLVGAGPLGKIYCSAVRERGGIALDVGAVFDSWLNFHSRPEHRGGSGRSLSDDLLLTSDNVAKLSGIPREALGDLSVEELPAARVHSALIDRYKLDL